MKAINQTLLLQKMSVIHPQAHDAHMLLLGAHWERRRSLLTSIVGLLHTYSDTFKWYGVFS